MNDNTGDSVRTIESITQLVHFEGHILSTRSADAYKAVDKRNGQSLCIWKMRHPLMPSSEAATRFCSRIESLRQIEGVTPQLLDFGVDSSGVAFVMFPVMDGQALYSGSLDFHEAERRFVSCLRLIDRLHRAHIICGDICASSFWLERSGELSFIGVMGSFDTEAAATSLIPPVESLQYVAPEQRAGGGLEFASDVFSLGVLGYFLFSGKMPFSSPAGLMAAGVGSGAIKPVSSLVPNLPTWVDEVLLKCLAADPGSRIQSAGAVLLAMSEARQKAVSVAQVPMRINKDSASSRSPEKSSTHSPIKTGGSSVEKAKKTRVDPRKAAILLLSVALAAGVGIIWKMVSGGPEVPVETKLNADLASHLSVADNPQIRQAIDTVRAPEIDLIEKTKQLESLVSSDDPIAHAILVKTAVDSESEELRAAAERSLMARARRLGLIRASEHMKQWLRTRRPGVLPQGYSALLKSFDITTPVEARASLLREAYPGNERAVLRLAAAYALDSTDLAPYQPLIAQLVGDSQHLDDAAKHSVIALILANPDLSLAFSDDAMQQIEKISDDEVLWLVRKLADRNDVNVRALANLAVVRNLIPTRRSFLFNLIKDRNDLSSDLIDALVRAGAGVLRKQDLSTFGNWFDQASEKILLSVCADEYSTEIKQEAFDILAGKSLQVEPAASVIKWLRQNHWESRAQLIDAIGLLGDLTLSSDDEIKLILDSFQKYSKDSTLVNCLIDSRYPPLLKGLVVQYGDTLSLSLLLNLLESSDKEVRLEAVKVIAKFNDLGVLKIVLDHYEREKDPEVRTMYREKFWMIKERENRK